MPSQSKVRTRKLRPEHLLDLQGPPQSEAASGLVIEHNLSLFAHGALSQPLEEFAHLVLAFDYGPKPPDGSPHLQIRFVKLTEISSSCRLASPASAPTGLANTTFPV